MSDPVYNAADEGQVKGRQKKEVREGIQAGIDIKAVMSTPEGRRFMHRLIGFCGIHQPSFNTNALAMAFREGHRNVGLYLETEITSACPSSYLLMQSEAIKETAS